MSVAASLPWFLDSRLRGNDEIAGIAAACDVLDSRLRGNDEIGGIAAACDVLDSRLRGNDG